VKKQEIPPCWALVIDKETQVVGETTDIIPIAYRNKAVNFKDYSAPMNFYDKNEEGYKAVVEAQKSRKGKGYMHGPVILCIERSTGSLCELFFGNPSGRREATKLAPFLQAKAPCTLGMKFIEGKDGDYHVPTVRKCSEPFEDLPSIEVIQSAVEKFMEEKKGPEVVKEEDQDSRVV
jgi:hypothetical protein